ncbi:MAG: tyrosine-type recombinase/integrase [Eubacteriales bacterium]|nr:tyrosine-type recombinase/integrase [Eubacteriales bacterium]
MTFNSLFDDFIIDKQAGGCSPKTIADYMNKIHVFQLYAGRDMDISEFTDDFIKQYCIYINRIKKTVATRYSYINALKIVLGWIEQNTTEPIVYHVRRIRSKRPQQRVVLPLSDTDVINMFKAVSGGSAWLIARNKAIVALMLDSGLRQGEVVKLRLAEIDFNSCVLVVLGKGSKKRLIPIGKVTSSLIKDYISSVPYPLSDYLFISSKGCPLTENAVKKMVYRLKSKTGYDVSSHKLRHDFATDYALRNIRMYGNPNKEQLQLLLGHTDGQVTDGYIHLAYEQIAVDNYSSRLDGVAAAAHTASF